MEEVPAFVYVACFSLVASFGWMLWAVAGARHRPAAQRAMLSVPETLRARQMRSSAATRAVVPVLDGLTNRVRRLFPAEVVGAQERKLRHAGAGVLWTPERYLALRILVVGLGVVAAALYLQRFGAAAIDVAAAGLLVLISVVAPDAVLARRAGRRRLRIQRELPDVLDQITVAVEAGLGFEAAMARVAEQSDTDLGHELAHVLQDIEVGVPRTEAMTALAERTGSDDLQRFVTALIQAAKLGVPIAKVLRVQSKLLREQRRLRAEERAMRLPVLLVFPLVLCVLPALFVVILAPAVIDIFGEGGLL
jgi:tight adherence protein C